MGSINNPQKQNMKIRPQLFTCALTLAFATATYSSTAADELPKLKEKKTYKVGFSQTESNNPWRLAETESVKSEAAKRGWQLVYTDAAGSAAKEVSDVRSMIAQRVDVILLAPREEKPLVPAVMEAKNAGIPLFCIDRSVDATLAKPGRDYVAFIGSDFVKEGQMCGVLFAKAVGNKAKIIQLEGTTGSSPANDRAKGFKDAIKDFPDMQIIASQSGDFARDKGRQVFEALYQAHPEATALYSHNDEMSMGAIAAMEAAGKTPGKDLLIASIDGTKDAAQAVADGKIAVLVECNPHFGPKAFQAIVDYADGKEIPTWVVNTDRTFTKDNIQGYMPEAF